MAVAVGEAPGKILLMGEHAVVYGHPAIAIPLRSVGARAEVEFTRNGQIEVAAPDLNETAHDADNASPRLAPLVRLTQTVLELFGEQTQGLRLVLRSTIPIGRGLGSGTAVAVATVRAICSALGRRLDADQVSELAMEAEREFHGTPSGVDAAVVARDEPIYFVRGKPVQGITVGPSTFRFLVADTGVESVTAVVVDDVRLARERDRARYDSFFWELGSLTSVVREVLRTGMPAELGICMNRAHRALQQVGVSCPELDLLVKVAQENGALGAKLSGAGRGGAAIILYERPEEEDGLVAELLSAGAENVFSTVLAGK